MARRLVLIRHATSPHPSDIASDHERPIREEGRSEARDVARRLVDLGWIPERVVTSDARRARETWSEMAATFDEAGRDPDAESTRTLYGASATQIRELAWSLPPQTTRVGLVGHNPGFSDVTSWLTDLRVQMPCGAAALLRAAGDTWPNALQQGSCELVDLVRPAAVASL